MKAALAEQNFAGPVDAPESIRDFPDNSQRSELEYIFHHWIERVRRVLDRDGDYFHESIFHHNYSFKFRFGPLVATIY
jgi:hypothetical protein